MARAAIKKSCHGDPVVCQEDWKRENTSNLPASDADAYSNG